ncbi:MAG TPA: hypothetical protein VLB44_01960, partial [Kofleriaceae bacterium]|nr:hypothetical protein [Kofleriaceae bacterium]
SLYAREAPAWVLQARGQNWFDLLIVVPWLVICGLGARTTSYRWRVLLAGSYAYVVYEMFIYTFAVHFNSLFLVYCATLGIAAFGLIAATDELRHNRRALDRRVSHLAGAFLVGLGAMFTLLWLAEDIPAMLRNTPPPSLVEAGLFTNPVHAIDLSFVLPAHIVVGVAVWHRRRSGEVFAPVLLAFGVVMSASIAGMMIVIALIGGEAPLPLIVALVALSGATAAMTARVLYPRSVPAVVALHH